MLITDSDALNAWCSTALRHTTHLYVDTEFVRETTYTPELCLVQLAADDGECVIVDCLAPSLDLTPLYQLLLAEHICKIFHAARQDIEIFVAQLGIVPTPFIDTQLGAALLGLGEQLSYAALVKHFLGESLDKTHQHTNWKARPLHEEQYRYAHDDVYFLRRCYPKLRHALHKKNRLAWLEEDMQLLASPAYYRTDFTEAWRRLKPKQRDSRTLARLAVLAAWREAQAERQNVARGLFWMTKH